MIIFLPKKHGKATGAAMSYSPGTAGGRIGVLAIVAGASILSSVGCVGQRNFYISGNLSPCANADELKGTGSGSGSSSSTLVLSSGVLDISAGQGYRLYPQLVNELPKSANADKQPERNRLFLKRFEVDLDLGQLGGGNVPSALTSFDLPNAATIEPGGKLRAVIKIIPDQLVAMLTIPSNVRPIVIANIRAIAEHGATDIESREFRYAVELCKGCLIQDIGDCSKLSGQSSTQKDQLAQAANACGHPQDDRTVCCRATGGSLRCLSENDFK